MNILVVDDEPNILKLIEIILSKEGYNVIVATDGAKALELFYNNNNIDMLICDEMMPVISGNELVKLVRENDKNIPIIMVTAKKSVNDKYISFSLGIDDYMTKPISPEELVMRVKAIFRRCNIFTEKKIDIGDIVLDYNSKSIINYKTNQSLVLTKKEFEIIYKLFSYPEKIFTKWQLFNEFWGLNSDTDESIVRVFISKIRKRIEIFPEIEIKTVMGMGYQGVKNEK